MIPMGSSRRGSRRGPSPRILLAAVSTAVILPIVIADLNSKDASNQSAPATSTSVPAGSTEMAPSSAPLPTSTTTSTVLADEGDGAKVPPQKVELKPSWLPHGSSVYSEDDEATQRRISQLQLGAAAVVQAPKDTTVAKPGGSTTTVAVPSSTAPKKSSTLPPEPAAPSPSVEPQPPATTPVVPEGPPAVAPETAPSPDPAAAGTPAPT